MTAGKSVIRLQLSCAGGREGGDGREASLREAVKIEGVKKQRRAERVVDGPQYPRREHPTGPDQIHRNFNWQRRSKPMSLTCPEYG